MLHMTVKANVKEYWDESISEFVTIGIDRDYKLVMEHSLVSISKWESKYRRAFLDESNTREGSINQFTQDELFYYIKCMMITQNVPDEVYASMSAEEVELIAKYIDTPQTATIVDRTHLKKEGVGRSKVSKDKQTSEVLYYMMFTYNIPKECEKWHITRLLALIDVFSVKNAPEDKKRKRSANEILRDNARLNAERKAQLNTKG